MNSIGRGGVFFAALLSACGAPLRPAALENPSDWDAATAEVYLRPDAVPLRDRSSLCGGTRVELTRRSAEVLFVIDRSGSMNEATADGASKWYAMLRAFRDVLPRVQSDLTVKHPRPEVRGF